MKNIFVHGKYLCIGNNIYIYMRCCFVGFYFWYCWVYMLYFILYYVSSWIYILYGALLMLNNRWNLRNFYDFFIFIYLIYISFGICFCLFCTLLFMLMFCKSKSVKRNISESIYSFLFQHFSKLNLHTIGMSWIFFLFICSFLSRIPCATYLKQQLLSTWNIMKCPSCVALFLNLCT